MINRDLSRISYSPKILYDAIKALKIALLHRIINTSIHFHIPKSILYTHAHAHKYTFYKFKYYVHAHPPSYHARN